MNPLPYLERLGALLAYPIIAYPVESTLVMALVATALWVYAISRTIALWRRGNR